MVLSADTSTLIVAESMAARLTAFAVGADGSLTGRRVWAELGPHGGVPDGICGDADGCVWVASPPSQCCLRVAEGGTLLQRVTTVGRLAIACMLGGPNGRTLFVLTSDGLDPVKCAELRTGRIEAVEVEVPAAGWP
jgi:sugar lactone lactonase YvrE